MNRLQLLRALLRTGSNTLRGFIVCVRNRISTGRWWKPPALAGGSWTLSPAEKAFPIKYCVVTLPPLGDDNGSTNWLVPDYLTITISCLTIAGAMVLTLCGLFILVFQRLKDRQPNS